MTKIKDTVEYLLLQKSITNLLFHRDTKDMSAHRFASLKLIPFPRKLDLGKVEEININRKLSILPHSKAESSNN